LLEKKLMENKQILVALKLEAPEILEKIDKDRIVRFVHITDKLKLGTIEFTDKPGPESMIFMSSANIKLPRSEFKFTYENQVVDLIKDEFKDYNVQTQISTGLYPVDLYFPKEKLVVEVDGASHYYQLEDQETAKSLFKYRMFEKVGIDFIRLSYLDYATKDITKIQPHEGYTIKKEEIIKVVREKVESRKDKPVGVDIESVFSKLLLS
jgi:very-short-patch-repair endonuclease